MDGERLSIGEVAQRTGLSAHTLRYYERAGLVPNPITRSAGGERIYDGADVTWFEICASLRRSGMPIASLRRYTELVRQGEGTELERLELLQQHRSHLDAELTALQAARELVDLKIGMYRASLAEGTAATLWVHTQPGLTTAREGLGPDGHPG